MDATEIKKIIPHREPFLLVDEILSIEAGKKATAIKHVREDEWYFKGHFPDYPIMPGVLIVEAMAQVGAIALLSLEKNKGKIALFAGIDGVRFKKEVIPGDKLKLEVEIDRIKGSVGKGVGKAFVDEDLVSTGELIFAIKDD